MAIDNTSESGPVIDFSAHFYASKESVNDSSPLIRLLKRSEGPISWDIDLARKRWTDSGLDGAVLTQPSYLSSSNAEKTRAANDALLELIDPYPELFALSALPMRAGGEVAAEEFERTLMEGYNGGAIESWVHNDEVTLETLEPVFEVADRTGAPLFIHPKVSHSLGEGVLEDEQFMNAIFNRDIALAACIYTTIQQGYIDRFPNLNLVVHHMAGNIQSFLGRIEGIVTRKAQDVKILGDDVELKSFDEFMDQLRSNIYMEMAGYGGQYHFAQRAFEVWPDDHLLFGSDFPCETRSIDDYTNLIESIRNNTSPELADKILGQNTLDLLVNVKETPAVKSAGHTAD